MTPSNLSIPVYDGPIVVTPGGPSWSTVDVPWSFVGKAVASRYAHGEVDVLGYLPGFGDTSPTHLLTFHGGETITFPPTGLSPAMPYLIVERLDSGSVTLFLPEPGVWLCVAMVFAMLARRIKPTASLQRGGGR